MKEKLKFKIENFYFDNKPKHLNKIWRIKIWVKYVAYAEKVNFEGNNYMAKIKFANAADYNGGKYMRVLYAAENPDSTASVDMLMRRDAGS